MRKAILITALLLLAGTVIADVPRTAQPSMMQMKMMPMMDMRGSMDMKDCPMKMEGVNLSVVDTPDGVSVVFTTTTGDVAALRERVRNHVEMMNHMRH